VRINNDFRGPHAMIAGLESTHCVDWSKSFGPWSKHLAHCANAIVTLDAAISKAIRVAVRSLSEWCPCKSVMRPRATVAPCASGSFHVEHHVALHELLGPLLPLLWVPVVAPERHYNHDHCHLFLNCILPEILSLSCGRSRAHLRRYWVTLDRTSLSLAPSCIASCAKLPGL
jgi:hypothetical protein